MELSIISCAEKPELYPEADRLAGECWPEFMLHDPIANRYFNEFVETFPDHQFFLMDKGGDLVGLVNSVPFSLPEGPDGLSREGWDWAVVKSLADYKAGRKPDTLCGLQICLDPRQRGGGLSGQAVAYLRQFRKERGYQKLVVPVRPNEKHLYPSLPMEDYLLMIRDDGLPKDPWLRVHVRQGGEIGRICDHSMKIEGTLAEWETWTGVRFSGEGPHYVPGALCPVDVDWGRKLCVYTEPNVWVVHR